MSTTQYQQPLYRMFEVSRPVYLIYHGAWAQHFLILLHDLSDNNTQSTLHPERPIIVEDGIESPGTVTLKYEEETGRGTRGDPHSNDSTPSLLPMAAYKTQPAQLHGELTVSSCLARTWCFQFYFQFCFIIFIFIFILGSDRLVMCVS